MKGLNPKESPRWVECPGSVKMQHQYPPSQTNRQKAEEGIASHWYASQVLAGRTAPAVSDETSNNVFLDQEMIDAAEVYINALQSEPGLSDGAVLNVEESLNIPGFDNMKGIPDAWFLVSNKPELVIYDYKYGRSTVEATLNWQMITEAVGLALYKYQYVQKIRVVVVQPRSPHHLGPVREWGFDRERLKLLEGQLQVSAQEAHASEPPTKAGKHCNYCSAAHACVTLQQASLQDPLAVIGNSETNELKPNQLGTMLKIVLEVEAEIKALKTSLLAQAEQFAKEGKPGSGYVMTQCMGNLAWKPDVVADVVALGEAFKLDLMKPPALITPTQAKAKGLPEKIVTSFSSRPSTTKLKPEDLEHVASVFKIQEEI